MELRERIIGLLNHSIVEVLDAPSETLRGAVVALA